MKVDVILHAHGLVKDAVIPVQALAQAPAQALAQAPVLALVRAVIISAQLPVLNLVRDVPDVADAEVPAAIVQDPVQQAVRAIVAGPAGISVSDRRLHRYIQFN